MIFLKIHTNKATMSLMLTNMPPLNVDAEKCRNLASPDLCLEHTQF